jgi:hypothetical protein
MKKLAWFVAISLTLGNPGRLTAANKDGKPDIVWRNVVTGENAIWFMNGAVLQANFLIQPHSDLSWFLCGALLLAKDDDSYVPDESPLIGEYDDVPYYCEFIIRDPKKPWFQGDYAADNFNHIRTESDLTVLLDSHASNIKQVTDIEIPINGKKTFILGAAPLNRPTIVLCNYATPVAASHEWLHTAGLRDLLDYSFKTNFMYNEREINVEQTEINRIQREFAQQWNHAEWDE